jgi:two-component system, cell cycle response regulator
MTGRILIVDPVANNRIMLKVKMQAAQFSVMACADPANADQIIAQHRPDLILLNMADAAKGAHAFCAALRADPARRDIAIIAVGVADTAPARFAVLDAGADDVLARPLHDALLLARIRSLLRARALSEDLALRDTTSRALGFQDRLATFHRPAHIALIGPLDRRVGALVAHLNRTLDRPVQWCDAGHVLRADPEGATPDLFIIPVGAGDNPAAQLHLVSDLRSRVETRLAAVLVVVPADAPDLAALFLDLGADDVADASASAAEIGKRANVLVARKHHQDRLRRNLRDGLQAAMVDPLTGAFNRRYLDHHLPRLAEQSRNAGRALAVMMVDIDHFKAVNDRYGHAAGDRVLVALAGRLRDHLRTIDLLARIGGEEFLIAMPRATAAQAQIAADRIRRLVNQTPFDLGEAFAPARITISVGVALGGQHGPDLPDDLGQMCDLADAALYRAKSAGRDRVMLDRSAA